MPPLLQAIDLQKSYSVPVLTDFSFELEHGEVHALIGANGAGKSTFARIVCAITASDSGRMLLNGVAYTPASRREAEGAGVVMVLQELNVIPSLSVAENIFLGRLPSRLGFVKNGELRAMASKALGRVGLSHLDPFTPAAELGVGQQQLVEIAGALVHDCKVLILDEPTAALTDPEIDQLFANIRRLQKEGVGIIYISHRMDEIRRISNRVTVLRDGKRIVTQDSGASTPDELIRHMVGHELPARPPANPSRSGEAALRVQNLVSGDKVRGVTFEVNKGEILGMAGLIGAGRTETLRAIFGAEKVDSGDVFLGDSSEPLRIRTPRDAVKAGIGMVPEDRKHDGLLLPQPIRVNTTLSTLPEHALAGGWIDTGHETRTATTFGTRLNLRCADYEQCVGELSGGNQQKVVISRWLARNCQVLLFDEPTRGIDVAAKDLVYRLLRELAAEGLGVVFVSSETVELMAVCDRILVLSAGKIAAQFLPHEWTQEKITKAAFSGHMDSARHE